jgi:hypothetical protein
MGYAVSPLIPLVPPPEAQPVRSARIETLAPQQRAVGDRGEGPNVYTVVAPDASPWYRAALDRISDLTALAIGWNGYDAQEVKADTAMQAVTFLAKVAYPGIAPPAIVPISDGGVQVEWHRGGLDIEIAFSDEEPGVFVEDREDGTSQELALAEAVPTIARYWQRLRET